MRQSKSCPHCYQVESDCDCAGEWELCQQALGIDKPATLADVAQATIAENRYIRASIDAQLRRTSHVVRYGGSHAQSR